MDSGAAVGRPRSRSSNLSDPTRSSSRATRSAHFIASHTVLESITVSTKPRDGQIDAKVGGFGMVPVELDGAIVSSHYFLFEINPEQLDYRFLEYYIRTTAFQSQISAQGSTN